MKAPLSLATASGHAHGPDCKLSLQVHTCALAVLVLLDF